MKSTIVGEVASTIGSAVGGYLGNTVLRGSKVLNTLTGGIVGDYIMGTAADTASWYSQNKERYKGLGGKARLIADEVGFTVRDVPAAAASYLAYAPLGYGLLAAGLPAAVATGGASVLSSLLYVGASYFMNKGKLKSIQKEDAAKRAAPAYSPG